MKPLDQFPNNEVQKQHERSFSSNNSNVWMRWEYSPEEWRLFERVDWQPVNLRFWLMACLGLVLPAGIGLILWSSTSGNFIMFVPGLLLLWSGVPGLIFFLMYTYTYGEARKRHSIRQQQGRSHTITINSKGLWEAGVYFPLNDYPCTLKSVSMTSEPNEGPVLHFHLRRSGYKTSYYIKIRIPVPAGHEQEATNLLQRFQIEVIQAREEQRQRWENPPEPK